jgi:hypothetical protein
MAARLALDQEFVDLLLHATVINPFGKALMPPRASWRGDLSMAAARLTTMRTVASCGVSVSDQTRWPREERSNCCVRRLSRAKQEINVIAFRSACPSGAIVRMEQRQRRRTGVFDTWSV